MGLTITLLSLTGWHVYLILHNMTTIEVGFSLMYSIKKSSVSINVLKHLILWLFSSIMKETVQNGWLLRLDRTTGIYTTSVHTKILHWSVPIIRDLFLWQKLRGCVCLTLICMNVLLLIVVP
jgi:hypothetical protein